MTDLTAARDARSEAQALLGADLEARVLEPSPPAVTEGPFFADDPVDASGASRPVVAPVGGARTWDDWAGDHPEHRIFLADRWLGAYKRLPAPPTGLARTRTGLHRVATHVLTTARYAANGKIGLRFTAGGFGTPFFDDDVQLRVVGGRLVRQVGDDAEALPITSLGAAAAFALGGPPDTGWATALKLHDPPPAHDPDVDLGVDEVGARFLGDWFGFAFSVLEALRADAASVEASRPQLWPEHFDPAIEVLPDRKRASYGFSPGDDGIPEPYVYISVWYPDAHGGLAGDLWNAASFPGAALRLGEFVDADDQRGTVLAWLRERRDALA